MTRHSDAELETRVARAYDHARPSPAVGEELLRSLPTTRTSARRPAWGRFALAAAAAGIAAVVLLWPRARPDVIPPVLEAPSEFSLPALARPRQGAATVEQLDAPRQIVQLTQDGTVLVPEWLPFRGGMRAITLDGLAERLEEGKRLFHEEERKRGGDGYEDLEHGRRASRLNVALRIDGDAPWQHVQWLQIVCAERVLWRTWWVARDPEDGGEYLLDARLPTDRGLAADAQRKELRVQVMIVTRKGAMTPRGYVPTEVVYRVGTTDTDSLSVVGKWVDEAVRAASGDDARVVCDIKAEHRIPFRHVAQVLAIIRDRGIERVYFYGTQLPSAEIRRADTLPYPTDSGPGSPGDEDPEDEDPREGADER